MQRPRLARQGSIAALACLAGWASPQVPSAIAVPTPRISSGEPVVVRVSRVSAGSLREAMSTSFQIAPWNDWQFPSLPGLAAQLTALDAPHVNMQAIDGDIPETAPGIWSFTNLDATVQPLLSAGDHSPLMQIGAAPAYLYNGLSSGFVNADFLSGVANYAAKLVQYYNAGGFSVDGTSYASPSSDPISYWGIFNEPNYNGISPAEYVRIYNSMVPAMTAVDPAIKIVALELGGGFLSTDREYLPEFVQNVSARVDAVGIHFYGTCRQSAADAEVMQSIAGFVREIHYIQQQLGTVAKLRNVPVWVLESNVDADYPNRLGQSNCTPSVRFVTDTRANDAFFAAWRSYEYSQFGKAGVQALYHWDFAGDKQFGELNAGTNGFSLQLSYWVDYWLGHLFPVTVSQKILAAGNSDPGEIEVLATERAAGSTVVMLSNHGVASASDDDGAGVNRTVLLDTSALGSFTSVKQVTIDRTTSVALGPVERSVPYAARMPVALTGYGVTFLSFQ